MVRDHAECRKVTFHEIQEDLLAGIGFQHQDFQDYFDRRFKKVFPMLEDEKEFIPNQINKALMLYKYCCCVLIKRAKPRFQLLGIIKARTNEITNDAMRLRESKQSSHVLSILEESQIDEKVNTLYKLINIYKEL